MSIGSVSDSSPGSVSTWIVNLRSGSEVAAREIFERYFFSLRRLVRQQLKGFPTRIVDDEDLALSVIDTLFRGVRGGRFDRMKDRTHLWGLLIIITRQQIVDHKRWESREKRSLTMAKETLTSNEVDIFGNEPSPELMAEVNDLQRHLFQVLRTDELRYIAAAKLEGYGNGEIAEKLGITPRSVQRKVNQIYERWSRELG